MLHCANLRNPVSAFFAKLPQDTANDNSEAEIPSNSVDSNSVDSVILDTVGFGLLGSPTFSQGSQNGIETSLPPDDVFTQRLRFNVSDPGNFSQVRLTPRSLLFLAEMTSPVLTSVSHCAMATEFEILLPGSDAHHVDAALDALESLDRIESSLTVYDPNSEISQVNRWGFQKDVPLTDPTLELMERSLRWCQKTDGAFDITAGPLVRAWGFTQRRGRKPSRDEIDSALSKVGYQKIKLDREQRSIRLLADEMEINLGAIGKGHALDKIVDQIKACGVENALIHGGNSSVIAIGHRHQEEKNGWPVGIAHPTKSNRRLGQVRLTDAALATSGSGKQYFHHQGRRYGHVIDPRTGYPAGDLLSLTVIANNATDAEALSTGYFVEGSEGVSRIDFCGDMQDADFPPDHPIGMIVVEPGKRQDSVRVTRFGSIDWEE